MVIPAVESFSRMGAFHYVYAEASEKGYSEYLQASSEMETIGDVEHDEKLEDIRRRRDVSGLQAIVFSAMSFEAAIYDFASVHLGDDYVRDHLDRLDVLSKWLVVLRFVAGVELPKGEAPYAALKSLVFERNRLVHAKSEFYDFESQERQFAKVVKRKREFEANVHNSFRALVLMSLYLDKSMLGHHNPLPSYDKLNAPMRRYYCELKGMIEECRNVVDKIRCS